MYVVCKQQRNQIHTPIIQADKSELRWRGACGLGQSRESAQSSGLYPIFQDVLALRRNIGNKAVNLWPALEKSNLTPDAYTLLLPVRPSFSRTPPLCCFLKMYRNMCTHTQRAYMGAFCMHVLYKHVRCRILCWASVQIQYAYVPYVYTSMYLMHITESKWQYLLCTSATIEGWY